MVATLLFRDIQGRDGVVELRGLPVYVGRGLDCSVRSDDAMVSRRHAVVMFEDEAHWVEDLGSSNGTHVNDVKVTRQSLVHNDVVRCGSLWLRYVVGVAPTTSAERIVAAPRGPATSGPLLLPPSPGIPSTVPAVSLPYWIIWALKRRNGTS